MEPTTALAAAKLILPIAARSAAPKVKRLLGGDPQIKALAAAIDSAFDAVRREYPELVARHDLSSAHLRDEALEEIARILCGRMPSETALAGALVDGLAQGLDMDARWSRLETLRPMCSLFLCRLQEELSSVPELRPLLPPPPTSLDEARDLYLRWVTQSFRHVDTTGIGTIAQLQLPLSEVYVSVRASRRAESGERWTARLAAQIHELETRMANGSISQKDYRDAIDRMRLQSALDEQGLSAGELPSESPEDAAGSIMRSPKVVVIGDPGSGKTTLLRFLALHNARASLGDPQANEVLANRPRFPIYIPIAAFTRSESAQSLREYMAEAQHLRGCPVERLGELFEKQLDGGNALLLLDGLDEVGAAERRIGVVEAVKALVATVEGSGNHIVVTTRPVGYDSAPLPASFEHLEVVDMSDDDISQFLERYLPAAIRAGAESKDESTVAIEAKRAQTELLAAFRQNPSVRRLAVNPLLLTALVLVHRSAGQLPASRIEAYTQIEKALTRTWRTVQGVPTRDRPDPDLVQRWLRRAARWIHRNRPERAASLVELLPIFGPLLCANDGIAWDASILDHADPLDTVIGRHIQDTIEAIGLHTGMLIERAPGRWGFPHLTFQEYYVALSFLKDERRDIRPAILRSHIHQSDYTEVLLLSLALLANADESDEDRQADFEAAVFGTGPRAEGLGLAPSDYEEYLGRDFLFALHSLADDVRIPVDLAERLCARALEESTVRDRPTRYRSELQRRLSRLRATKFNRQLQRLVVKSIVAPDRAEWFDYLVALLDVESVDEQVARRLVEHLRDDAAGAGVNGQRLLAIAARQNDKFVPYLAQSIAARPDFAPWHFVVSGLFDGFRANARGEEILRSLADTPDVPRAFMANVLSYLDDFAGGSSEWIWANLWAFLEDVSLPLMDRVRVAQRMLADGVIEGVADRLLRGVDLQEVPLWEVPLLHRALVSAQGPTEATARLLVRLSVDEDSSPYARCEAIRILIESRAIEGDVLDCLGEIAWGPEAIEFAAEILRCIAALCRSEGPESAIPLMESILIAFADSRDGLEYGMEELSEYGDDDWERLVLLLQSMALDVSVESVARIRACSTLSYYAVMQASQVGALSTLLADPAEPDLVRCLAVRILADSNTASPEHFEVASEIARSTDDPDALLEGCKLSLGWKLDGFAVAETQTRLAQMALSTKLQMAMFYELKARHGLLTDSDVVEIENQIMEDPHDWRVRQVLATTLRSSPSSIVALESSLRDPDNDVRKAAACSLAVLGRSEKAALVALIAAIRTTGDFDDVEHRSVASYAWDGLWDAVVGAPEPFDPF